MCSPVVVLDYSTNSQWITIKCMTTTSNRFSISFDTKRVY